MRWDSLLGLLIGVFGIVIAFYFHRKEKKRKAFSYVKVNNLLIEDSSSIIDGLKVTYKNQDFENLSVTKLAFWNDGDFPIKRDDISTINPLGIDWSPPIGIIDVLVVYSSSKANGVTLSFSNELRKFVIDFEYLDPKEGGIIQIVHTNKSDDEIHLSGKIIGVQKITTNPDGPQSNHIIPLSLVIILFMLVFTIIIIELMFMSIFVNNPIDQINLSAFNIKEGFVLPYCTVSDFVFKCNSQATISAIPLFLIVNSLIIIGLSKIKTIFVYFYIILKETFRTYREVPKSFREKMYKQ